MTVSDDQLMTRGENPSSEDISAEDTGGGHEDMDIERSTSDDEEQTRSNGNMFDAIRQKAFPSGFKYETVELLKFAWPVVTTQVLSRTIRIMPTAFSGQLGKLELGGTSMAISIVNVAASSIGIGMIAACETSFSQSYGSSNKKQVGVYLQTAIYMSTLLCIISWAFLLNANSLLLALGQNTIIAKYTEEYLFIFMPAILFLLAYQLLSRYLQVQGLVLPCVFIGLLANAIDIVLQYLLVYTGSYGLKGSAAAQFITYFVLSAGVISYIYFTKSYKLTWDGWSLAALQEWFQFFKLAMSTIMMISVEWWAFEVSMFLMGILGPVSLGANSIMYQIWMLYASISLGLGSAIAYRVGRYLGAETPVKAKTMAHAALVLGLILALLTTLFTLCLRWQIPQVFSHDPEVVKLGGEMLPILALFSFFGATKNVCAGIVRGTGRQYMGAVIITASYLVIALPIGIPLMFRTNVKAAGFWWGLSLGQLMAAASLLVMVFRLDWDVEVERALVRAKIKWKTNPQNGTREKITPRGSGMTESLDDHVFYGSVPEKEDLTLTTLENSSTYKQYAPNYWRNLVMLRVSILVICILVLFVGILTRYVFAVPTPVKTSRDNVTENVGWLI